MKKCLSVIFLIYPNSIKKAWLRTIFVLSLLSISGGVNASSIPAPTGVSASNGSYTSYVQVSWDSVSSATTYAIYRSTSENGTYLQIADSPSSPYNDTSAAAGTTYYYKIKACTGSVGSIACGNYSDYASGYISSVPIADAIDNTNLSFTSSGDANWFGQTQTFYYDSDAAQSGNIDDKQQSCMQTTVAGSSDLSFYWKVSSEGFAGYLRFYIDDIEQSGKISGEIDWQQKSYVLSAGEKVLKWCYNKHESYFNGDMGWVDKIVHATNDSSISAPSNVSASNGSYTSYVQVSWDSISSVASYTVYRSTSENGTYLQIADSPSSPYNDTSAAAGTTYYYKIKACTGSVGSVACGNYSDYASGYLPSVPIADAIDNTNLSFTGSGDANWFGQTQTFYYDSDAAQSGDIDHSQQSCMQTTVTGSSDLSFYWKISSVNYNDDYLRFYIDNIEQNDKISGDTDWQQKFYQLSAGDKALKWCYTKDIFIEGGSDTGWVDKIVHATNDSSISAPSNVSASNGNYTSHVQVSWDSVSSTATYVIYRSTSENGTYSQIADSPSSPYNDTLAVASVNYYKIKACTGSVGSIACSNYSDYASGYISSVPIADAVDNASLFFTGSGDVNWFRQTQTFYYDSDAAQSGDIGGSQQSCMQTTVAGSSDLSFYWKVSSEYRYDYLRFYIDDSEQSGKISGDIDWQQKFYQLSAGDKALKWCYNKDPFVEGGSDTGWVDKIAHATNDSSISAPSNVSASNGSYTSHVQVSWDSVSSTATYAIYRSTSADGTYSQIADSPSSPYNDTSAAIGITYYYKIKACTGSVGSVACGGYSNYASGYISSALIADAIDNTNLSFTSSGDANWFWQTQTFYYDSDAAQSGDIGDSQQSCMQTTVAGSSDLSFYWKVSSKYNDDYLRFYIDDSEQSGAISGNIDWQQKSYVLSAGEKVLKWCYTKDSSGDIGSDAAWIDKIVYAVNDSSIPAPIGVSASNGSYTSYVQVSWDSVSSTATYVIYRSTSADGIYSQIADSPSSPYNDTLAAAGTTYYYKIKACTGLVGSVACSNYSDYASGYLPSVPIADAVDNTNLSFTGSGDANWFGQTQTFYYDSDAAQSGDIGGSQQSCMQTTFADSNDLSFHWKVSSESDYDYLRFYIDGSEQSKISGDTDWQQKSYVLSAGEKVLKWCYTKDYSDDSGSDAGWVDKIVNTANTSIPAPANVSASNGSYTSYVRVSWDSVSSTATYVIYRSTSADGIYLQIATTPSSPYDDTLAKAATTYYYKIKACTGSFGNLTCGSNDGYDSGYLPSVPIADAIDNTNLSFTSSGDANWFGQTQTFYYDSDAAQSGDIDDSQQSCMQTTVAGSSDLSFYWKASSHNYDYFRFYIDDSEQSGRISGDTDWQQKFYQLSAGNKTLKWCYIKNILYDNGSDAVWVDKIVHATNDSSISAPSNVSASNGSYTSYVQVSWDSVSSAATYAIYRSTSENGTYLQIANSQSLSYNDTSPTISNIYYYKIKACTGLVGSVACGNYSDYASGYISSLLIADAVDNTNLSFTSSGDANWFGQTQTFYYDSDAAQSGDIDHEQQSCVQTTVAGSSDLSFHWKVSSESDDYLRFYIDDSEQSDKISGNIDWHQKSYMLSAGEKVLKWCYTKDRHVESGNDTGWVDKIVNTANSAYTAPNIAFLPASITATVGIYIDIRATNTGGVATYSISPAIDNDLSFSTTTGVISGMPSAAATLQIYTITATNVTNSDSATLSITVNPAAPIIAFSPANITAVVGIYVDIVATNTGGVADLYSIAPTITNNLSFSTETGSISGTPTAVTVATYTVTASNVTGTDSATIEITVNPQAPNIVFLPANITTVAGIYIDISATNTGGVATYSISPTINNNLSFSTETGSISGTPTAVAVAKYTVTASNVTGSSTATIEITVNPVAPSIEISATTVNAELDVVITNITVINNGGTPTSYAISDTLSAGLSFSTETGTISGTPSATASATIYTVTATNITGTDSATVEISVSQITIAPSIANIEGTQAYYAGVMISPVEFTNSGDPAQSCASNLALPAGLNVGVSANSCAISGTPQQISSATAYTIIATNSQGSDSATISIVVKSFSLDADGNGTINASNDGLIIFKYLLNSNANNLHTTISSNAADDRKTTAQLKAYLDNAGTILDVDGNDSLAAPNDGLIIFKYLLNSNANNLHTTIANDAATDRKTTKDLKAYLDTYRK